MTNPPAVVLALTLGDREVGIDVGCVQAVLRGRPLTPVPGLPDGMLGLLSVGGEMVPVVDLARRLGEAAAASTPRYVLVEHAGERWALWVLGAMCIRRLEPGTAGPALVDLAALCNLPLGDGPSRE